MTEDEKWMRIAIEEAKLAMKENEIPVGSVLVQNEKIIAQAHNQPIRNNDPTAHAEIQLLRKAGKQQENYRLGGCTLYVTLEPCAMCFGAMIHARIESRGAINKSISAFRSSTLIPLGKQTAKQDIPLEVISSEQLGDSWINLIVHPRDLETGSEFALITSEGEFNFHHV